MIHGVCFFSRVQKVLGSRSGTMTTRQDKVPGKKEGFKRAAHAYEEKTRETKRREANMQTGGPDVELLCEETDVLKEFCKRCMPVQQQKKKNKTAAAVIEKEKETTWEELRNAKLN